MTRVTDFHLIRESGERALCDVYGNNVAFDYPSCGQKILRLRSSDE